MYTAVASYLDARHHHGSWLLRIDDLDTPRNVPGADDAILRCLEAFQLHWDGDVYYQSRNLESYHAILNRLQNQDLLYTCRCSRKQLNEHSIYPGFCRNAAYPFDQASALRLKTDDRQIVFADALQGNISQNIGRDHGDFVLRRRDQIIAYQFAVVVDDRQQGINHVVRGADLLDSTPKQVYQQQLLGYPTPVYMHLPLIVDSAGHKLSKQTLAAPVDSTQPAKTLWQLLSLLQQNPPAELENAGIGEQLSWATAHWQPQSLQRINSIHASAG